jgi:hypothetical protein
LWNAAKSRAKEKGREFKIELTDIVIPAVCPVLGVPMERPSLDRIDSSKGYVKGNVRVISHRANMLKNNATIEELELVLKDLKGETLWTRSNCGGLSSRSDSTNGGSATSAGPMSGARTEQQTTLK